MNAAILLSVALLSGCAATLDPQGIDGPVELGQIAAVGGLRVRADKVIEDSRCPVGTQCIWAGRVVLRATLLGGGGTRQIDLILGKPAPVAGGTLTLVSVLPERSGPSAPPRQLSFTFTFQGGR